MQNNAREVFEKIQNKYRQTAPLAAAQGIIPYVGDGKEWKPSRFERNSWWTGGFYPALMWQFYAASKDPFFMEEARRVQKMLVEEFRIYSGLHHDVGFMYLISCGADWKLTGNEEAKTDTLHAASLLQGRFNPVGFIRAWNGIEKTGYVIIDCMMNLSILFWASEVTGDPRFATAAKIHADTTLREFIRPNGSCSHIIDFDPATGKRVQEFGGQGYELGSAWSRGQAWGLYGFTLAYANTKEPRYLDAARRIASFFTAHIRPDGLTDCDFCQPAEPERIDNIAGACAACGLIELSRLTGDETYEKTAGLLLDGMINYCCDWSLDTCGVLTKCTGAYHADPKDIHTNMVYGDYFFTEALAKMCGTDPMLWRK